MKIFTSRPTGAFWITACLLVLLTVSVKDALSNSNGIFGQSKVGCTNCHGANPTAATKVVVSSAATEIVAGQTYDFQLVVKNPAQKGAGCDISVERGKFATIPGAGLRLFQKELTHLFPATFTGDSAVFKFKYTAPATAGVDHIYAAGNAVNLDGTENSRDSWNTTVLAINVVAPSGVEVTTAKNVKLTISPNPAVNTVTLDVNTGEVAQLQVIDAAGHIVRSTDGMRLDGGAKLDVSMLANGAYLLRASSGSHEYQSRFVIQR